MSLVSSTAVRPSDALPLADASFTCGRLHDRVPLRP